MLMTPDSDQGAPFYAALPWRRLLPADDTSATSYSLSRKGIFGTNLLLSCDLRFDLVDTQLWLVYDARYGLSRTLPSKTEDYR